MASVLIHIGFPKAASTYLQQWFAAHPGMYYQSQSIGGFYHAHDIARYAQSKSPIHDCFVLSSEDLSVWIGEYDVVGVKSAVFYDLEAYHTKLSQTLHRIYPQAKILIVTRGYVSYFNSLYAQYISSGGALSFEEFKQKFSVQFSMGFNLTYLINLYRETIGAENIILLPYELLRADPKAFTDIIEKEMGIEQSFAFTTDKINPAFNKKLLATYHKVSNLLVRLISPLPYKLQAKIYGFYAKKLNEKRPHPYMEFLARFTKKDIEIEGIESILEQLQGKAEILRNEKLYQPYLKEYLL